METALEGQKLLAERFNILQISSLFFLMLLLIAWRNDYFSSSRLSNPTSDKVSGIKVLWAFVIFLSLQILFVPLTYEIWQYFLSSGETVGKTALSPKVQGWFGIYAIWVSFIGIAAYFRTLPESTRMTIWGQYAFKGWKSKFEDFFIACVSWLLSYPLVVAVGQMIGILVLLLYRNIEPAQVAVEQVKATAASKPALFALILSVVFIVPFIEELLFRGFLQNWLKNSLGVKKAILLTSLIFAMFHFAPEQGVGNIELIVSLFVLSCFLGFIYERQKSLWASISMHGLFNALSIIFIFVQENEKK